MTISFEKAFTNHVDALRLRGKRMELLAANLANADTPGFKARDVDFRALLREAEADTPLRPVRLNETQPGHLASDNNLLGAEVMYRIPNQASLDGNTVESQIEQAKYAENALKYQVSMQFVSGTIKGLMTAIRGE